jgi:hypothetical protein
MLSVNDPSFEVMFVVSIPLNWRLFEVVRNPFTDGERFPLLLVSTGGRSALTPPSAESRWVKLRVEDGTSCNSTELICLKVVAVSRCTNSVPATMSTLSCTAPASSLMSNVRGTAASTSTASSTAFLKPVTSTTTR